MRRHDWPERLTETVRAARLRPFAWGRHDCALFACDCIAAMTGVDHAAAFRGKYRTAAGALRALRRIAGVATVDELATKLLGAPVAAAGARRGDVVLIEDQPDGPCLGVVLGRRAVFLAADGISWIDTQAAVRAWAAW